MSPSAGALNFQPNLDGPAFPGVSKVGATASASVGNAGNISVAVGGWLLFAVAGLWWLDHAGFTKDILG
jgi:hypothetical protein